LKRLTVSLRGGHEKRKGCLLCSFTGQLDAYSEKQFTTYINDVLKENDLSVVIDLSKIDFLDSTGLGAMVHIAKSCKTQKRNFIVVGNARVKQTIKLVKLEDFLHLVSDLTTAFDQLVV
tara:strand:- start:592 stop:948 length:357 start_codon:yes stop_codon:yes gene_type:complete